MWRSTTRRARVLVTLAGVPAIELLDGRGDQPSPIGSVELPGVPSHVTLDQDGQRAWVTLPAGRSGGAPRTRHERPERCDLEPDGHLRGGQLSRRSWPWTRCASGSWWPPRASLRTSREPAGGRASCCSTPASGHPRRSAPPSPRACPRARRSTRSRAPPTCWRTATIPSAWLTLPEDPAAPAVVQRLSLPYGDAGTT